MGLKYRLTMGGTFTNIKSIYCSAYSLKIKCDCGKEHDKRVTLDPYSVSHTKDNTENKKLNNKKVKDSFNLVVNCKECRGSMRIKLRDMEKKGELSMKSGKNSNKKRNKRKNKYKIEYVQINEENEVIQKEEKREESEVKDGIEEKAKEMNIDLNNLDKKKTSKKHEEVKVRPLDLYNRVTGGNDSGISLVSDQTEKSVKSVPLQPFQNNSFILAILETRNCSLLEEIIPELNILSETHLWENVEMDDGCWSNGDCMVTDGIVGYEKILKRSEV